MYTYYSLMEDIAQLKSKCCVGTYGKSILGNDLFFLYVGQPNLLDCAFSTINKSLPIKKRGSLVAVSGAIHARESESARLVVMQAKYAIENLGNRKGGILFLPMLNPDGNLIATGLMQEFSKDTYLNALRLADGEPLKLWKANSRGVDLNTNFDALFGQGKENTLRPSGKNFIGTNPFSEKETAALASFTRAAQPNITLSYHTKGRVIYWDFYQSGEFRDRCLSYAKLISAETDYELIDGTDGSAGGYKDWCVQKLNISSFTIELGKDELTHPVSKSDLAEDFKKNLSLPIKILDRLSEEKA